MSQRTCSDRLSVAFERLVNALTTGKKKGRNYGTGEILYIAEVHHLAEIGKHPGTTASEIIKRLGITKGATSQTLKKLESRGYITKYPKPENMKQFNLHLTKKGQIAFKNHETRDRLLVESLKRHMGDVEPEVIERFINLVDELTDFVLE